MVPRPTPSPEPAETFPLAIGDTLLDVPRLWTGLWQLSSPAWGTAPASRIRKEMLKHVSKGFTAFGMCAPMSLILIITLRSPLFLPFCPTHHPCYRYGTAFPFFFSPLLKSDVHWRFLPDPLSLSRVSHLLTRPPTNHTNCNPQPKLTLPRLLADHYGSAEPLFVSPAFYTAPTGSPH